MKTPIFSVHACEYKELHSHTPVFNKATLEYFLWVHLPDSALNAAFYEMTDLQSGKFVDLHFTEREPRRPWLKIIMGGLSSDIGKHIYQLKFVNSLTNDVFSLYISYRIQDDNPDKPYVYMKGK